MPLPVFEPVLAIALFYTFFHSFDTKRWLVYAFYCGFLQDIFSLDVFGLYIFSFILACLSASLLSRVVYRQNWFFVFPVVFVGVMVSYVIVLVSKIFFVPYALSFSQVLRLLSGFILESVLSTLLVYPLYLFSKRCVPELIG